MTFFAKLKNWWWYYHKLAILAMVVIAAVVYFMIADSRAPDADYHVGLVSATALSPEQISDMEEKLREAGEDRNSDGEVLVQLHTYWMDLADDSPNAGYDHYEIAAALDGDLVGNVSGIFLLEDPEALRQLTQGIISDTELPWENGLTAVVRTDADHAYGLLFDNLR